jgi:tetratricopeptide (TPR) repeat protein
VGQREATAQAEAGGVQALRAKLALLPPDAARLLAQASVLGREFDLTPLRYLAHRADDDLRRLLAEAERGGLVVAESGRTFRFADPALREAAYDGLPRATRAGLHRRVGEVLEGLYASDTGPHLSEIAHHFVEAAVRGSDRAAEKAVSYAARAAGRAGEKLAFEDATGHYERALQVLDASGGDDQTRCNLMLALGDAQWKAGQVEASRQRFAEAAAIARSIGSADRLARAALGFGGGRIEFGTVDRELIELLETADAALPQEDTRLRAALLGRLAVALYFTDEMDRRAALADQAVAVARRLGRPTVLGAALSARHFATWGPDSLDARLADANELLQLARDASDRALLLEARTWRIVDLLELGEFRVACGEIGAYEHLASEVGLALYEWYAEQFQAMRALAEGRFDVAEERAKRALVTGRRAGIGSAEQFFAVQMFVLRRDQGRLGELEDTVLALIDEFRALGPWHAGLVVLHLALGRVSQARREFEGLAGRGFEDVPRDGNWLITTALLAEACAQLGDAERAKQLYELLRPYTLRTVVVASAVAWHGPVSYCLGLLAATTGQWKDAAAHYEDALDAAARAGALPGLARTKQAYGTALLAAGRPGDRARAERLLNEARTAFDELGMAAPGGRGGADAP